MIESSRPLSPYLNYRWPYTNTLSILHRASGPRWSAHSLYHHIASVFQVTR